MTNFIDIGNSNDLQKIFDNAGDKLVVLLFYAKNNAECKRARSALDTSASIHNTSYFCVIDVDSFKGDSRYVNKSANIPKIDFYYMGNMINCCHLCNEIEPMIKMCEQHVMTTNNTKNNHLMQNHTMQSMQSMQPNPLQIRQQILNNAQMTNPQYYQQLLQNPAVLNQLIQQQMQYTQTMQPVMPVMPTMQSTIPVMQPMQPTIPSAVPVDNAEPTFQQMQKMFRIFIMMQQMGAIKIPTLINTAEQIQTQSQTQSQVSASSTTADVPDNIITLPDGRIIIPLPDGTFKLIKKT